MGNGRFFILTSLFCVAATGCATTSLQSRAAFSEQVVAPLADQRTAEIIADRQTQARSTLARREAARQRDGTTESFVTALGAISGVPGHPWTSLQSTKGSRQAGRQTISQQEAAELEQFIAWTETRRAMVKAKVLALYESRVQAANDTFTICIQGRERRYSRQPGFSRIEDGPNSCPAATVSLSD